MKQLFCRLFALSIAFSLTLSACSNHSASSRPKMAASSKGTPAIDSQNPEAVLEWLDQQYQKQVLIELELAAVRDQLAQIAAQGSEAEQYEIEMSEAQMKILTGYGAIALSSLAISQDVKIAHFLNGSNSKSLQAKIWGDLDKRRVKEKFEQNAGAIAERRAQDATHRFVRSNRFKRELEKVALESTQEVAARLKTRSDAHLLDSLERHASRLGRELTNAETMAITRTFEKKLQKQSKPAVLKAIAQATRLENQETLRFVLTDDYKANRLKYFTERGLKKFETKTLPALEARIAKSIENARKIGWIPASVLLVTVGSGVLYGFIILEDGLSLLQLSRERVSRYQEDLTAAELNLIVAQKEAETFMAATIVAAEEKGIDLKGLKTRGQELQAYVDRLIDFAESSASETEDSESEETETPEVRSEADAA